MNHVNSTKAIWCYIYSYFIPQAHTNTVAFLSDRFVAPKNLTHMSIKSHALKRRGCNLDKIISIFSISPHSNAILFA